MGAEAQVVEGVCDEVQKVFPSIHFDPDCETVVQGFLEAGLATFCPDHNAQAVPEEAIVEAVGLPTPQDIHKLICSLSAHPGVEDRAAEAVCNEVQTLFPTIHFDPDCKTTFDQLWLAGEGLFCQKSESLANQFQTAAEPSEIIV